MEALRPRSNLLSVCSVRQVYPTARQQPRLLKEGSSTNVPHLQFFTKLRRNGEGHLASNGAVWRNGNLRHPRCPQASMAGSSDSQGSEELKTFSFSTNENISPSNELNDENRAKESGGSLALTRDPTGTLVDALKFCGEKTGLWWKNTALWCKLPVAVFVPLFLFLRLFYGPIVTWNLLPLWILGPLLFGLAIWFYATVFRISKRTVKVTTTTAVVLSNRSVDFYSYASSGKLSEDLSQFSVKKKEQLEEKGKQVLLLTSGKKDALVKYVESGQMVEDASEKAKEAAKKRGVAFEEWLIRTYEDVIDWWRPTRRAISKLLQKVF